MHIIIHYMPKVIPYAALCCCKAGHV